jgi:surface antigen
MTRVLGVGALAAALAGCQSNAGNGALIGAGTGAGVGAIVGHQSGKTGQGAVIGGAIGAIGGGLIGNEMDRKEKEAARDREYQRYSETRSRAPGYDTGADYRATEYRDTSRQPAAAKSRGVTKDDVIFWSGRGDRDDLIIDRIEQSGATFQLTSREENDLRDSGVSEDVIRAMKDTARR